MRYTLSRRGALEKVVGYSQKCAEDCKGTLLYSMLCRVGHIKCQICMHSSCSKAYRSKQGMRRMSVDCTYVPRSKEPSTAFALGCDVLADPSSVKTSTYWHSSSNAKSNAKTGHQHVAAGAQLHAVGPPVERCTETSRSCRKSNKLITCRHDVPSPRCLQTFKLSG